MAACVEALPASVYLYFFERASVCLKMYFMSGVLTCVIKLNFRLQVPQVACVYISICCVYQYM